MRWEPIDIITLVLLVIVGSPLVFVGLAYFVMVIR